MAKGNNYQSFSQVDYCIRQYYSRYMASTIVQEKKLIEKNQNKEFMDALDKEDNRSILAQAADNMHGINSAYRAKMIADATGKWNKMSVDDLVKRCEDRWFKDKRFQNDYSTFVSAFYYNLVAQHGGKESKKLFEYAESYVQHRFQTLIIEQLAKEKVPRNTASYIAKKAFSDSLLAFTMPKFGLKDGELGEKVNSKAEAMYNPSAITKAAGFAGATLLDTAVTGGFGSASTTIKATLKGVSIVGDYGLRTYLGHKSAKNWSNEEYAKSDSKTVFGDENAFKKIQEGSAKYKKGGTEFINNINSVLSRKIKIAPLSISDKARQESNAMLVQHKGNSAKLLSTIKADFTKQCIPYNGNSQVPSWMLTKTSKQNRALASSFYALATEMSKEQKTWIKCGGKKMSFKEVSQRAYDYARAADIVDKHQAQLHRRAGFSAETQKALDDWDKNMARINAITEGVPAKNKQKSHQHTSSVTSSTTSSTSTSFNQGYNPYSQQVQQPQQSSSGNVTTPQTAGWGNALEQMGLSGFSDVSRNMGYVLAMLPDMLIGMFTGKNPNMKLEDNFLPLAAIFGGMFVKNPLLKMLLLGFGGANLFNNAGHAALKEGYAKTSRTVTYKTYSDEPLNKRISNPVMKGSSMVATIDGKPMVINISDNAVDAYERGNVPLNTLANAVLQKYDENNALVSRNYELHHQEENVEQQRGLK